MSCLARLLICVWLLLCVSCVVWEPVRYADADRLGVEAAESAFREQAELQTFFDEAVAYAVFPGSWRAGTGFGGAYGTGWLIESAEATGKVMLLEFFAGADLGVQTYRSILFFRTDKALRNFKKGTFEFTGQANAAHVVGGKAATPSYHPDVAMFVQVKGGLLLEASVGAQRYDYFPLAGTSLP